MADKIARQKNTMIQRTLRTMIIGIPNAGKSTDEPLWLVGRKLL